MSDPQPNFIFGCPECGNNIEGHEPHCSRYAIWRKRRDKLIQRLNRHGAAIADFDNEEQAREWLSTNPEIVD